MSLDRIPLTWYPLASIAPNKTLYAAEDEFLLVVNPAHTSPEIIDSGEYLVTTAANVADYLLGKHSEGWVTQQSRNCYRYQHPDEQPQEFMFTLQEDDAEHNKATVQYHVGDHRGDKRLSS